MLCRTFDKLVGEPQSMGSGARLLVEELLWSKAMPSVVENNTSLKKENNVFVLLGLDYHE